MVFYQFSYWEIFLKQFGDLVLTPLNYHYYGQFTLHPLFSLEIYPKFLQEKIFLIY